MPVVAVEGCPAGAEAEAEAQTEAQAEAQPYPGHGTLFTMSLAYLLPSRTTSIVWRGPKKTAMIRQFLTDVSWGPLDYLLIDTPPGTSDEHISLVESLLTLVGPASPASPLRGAILVTTPQQISTADVRKELSFCRKVSLPVLGVIENMAGFICPCCGVLTDVFSRGGGEELARETGVEFWGGVPLDEGIVRLFEERRGTKTGVRKGEDLVRRYRKGRLGKVYEGITMRLVEKVEGRKAGEGSSMS